ncbi:MAG: hypothetical protein E7324_03170 [Clostridiales bacterium]|nr:hypothetical protein [Clostridiales bacterium]
METKSLMLANYCVPCHAHCRYCLLCSTGKGTGADYARGKELALDFHRQIRQERPELSFGYYIGYCMDTPLLMDYIGFCRQIGSPSAAFLQFNGFRFRPWKELLVLMENIRDAGIEMIDVTLYGREGDHDAFAGRKGDFAWLCTVVCAANHAGIRVHISFPITRENMGDAGRMIAEFKGLASGGFGIFLPHSKGRGKSISHQRITRRDYDALNKEVKACFGKVALKTEKEWLAEGNFPSPDRRTLTWVLRPENADDLEQMGAEGAIRMLEEMDDAANAQMPAPEELAERYGERDNEQLFRFRDLLLLWKQKHIARMQGGIRDMNDETNHFSSHY